MTAIDLLARRAARLRAEKAKDDGSCPACGRYRVVCSPMGRPCVFTAEPSTDPDGDIR